MSSRSSLEQYGGHAGLTIKDIRQELEAFAKDTLSRTISDCFSAMRQHLLEDIKAELRKHRFEAAATWSHGAHAKSNPASVGSAGSVTDASLLDVPPQRTSSGNMANAMRSNAKFYLLQKETVEFDWDLGDNDSPSWSCRQWAQRVLQRDGIEHTIGILVVLNAAAVGFDTAYWAAHPTQDSCLLIDISEAIFCVIFTTELLLKLCAYRCDFYSGSSWSWNVFDIVLVLQQILDQVLRFLVTAHSGLNLSSLRILRVLRVIRIARLVRTLRLFDELRIIVSSISSSLPSLMWAFILFLGNIYLFSVANLQFILGARDPGVHTDNDEAIEYYFGSLFRSILTMFEAIVGGISWDLVVQPLVEDVSPLMGVMFCVYVSISLFMIMNILTGVFVDKAMSAVREDKDAIMARRMRDLFYRGRQATAEIDKSEFNDLLADSVMQEFLQVLGIDMEDADSLFELLDVDRSGALSARELVDGCLRLVGPARALDCALIQANVLTALDDIFTTASSQRGSVYVPIAEHEPQGMRPVRWAGKFVRTTSGSIRTVQPSINWNPSI